MEIELKFYKYAYKTMKQKWLRLPIKRFLC